MQGKGTLPQERIQKLLGIKESQYEDSAGSSLTNAGDTLNLNVLALLTEGEIGHLSSDVGVEKVIQEEVFHSIQVEVLSAAFYKRTGKTKADMHPVDAAMAEAADMWQHFPQGIKTAVLGVREIEKESKGGSAMEFFRMLLQHRISIDENNNVLDANGAIITPAGNGSRSHLTNRLGTTLPPTP